LSEEVFLTVRLLLFVFMLK